MTRVLRRGRASALWAAVVACAFASETWAVQAPVPMPPVHERQCVSTGDIPAGSARTVTVKWSRPFATGSYTVIGSVSDADNGERSIELSHVVMPYAPGEAAAVVFNRDGNTAHAGLLCLDASRE